MKNPIYPCLWFDNQAHEAAAFYCSVFNNSRVTSGNPIVSNFELSGQKFMCLNGGPMFKINPSISIYTTCETEEEIDRVWNQLIVGGSAMMPLDKYPWSQKYGWVQDRYGLTWQLTLGNLSETGQKFIPALMFTGTNSGKADEAIKLYTSLFKNSDTRFIARYEEGENDTVGNIKHAQFRLFAQTFAVMESSFPHQFSFNEGVSFVVECDDQQEIDYFWDNFTREGEESMCGWLKDKYGVSWQIIPAILDKLMSDPDKGQLVMEAFLKMKKFDINKLVNL
jgi:predicted 3-demethylubiquinone-9 3-methyltransferase (glyoxalase superfamily)